MSQNLSSAAVLIGALKVKKNNFTMLLLIVTVMNYIAYLIHILIKVVAGSFRGFMMQFILFPFQSIHP